MSFPELWRRILEVRRSRRSFLVHLCSGAAATLFPPALTAEPTRYSGFQMGGNPVEMWLTGVNEQVLRASILPAGFPYPPSAAFADGSLLARTWPQPKARLGRAANRTISWGRFKVHVTSDPLTIRVEDNSCATCQQLAFDMKTGWVSFALGNTPVFGLGEGGRQFDRRGVIERNENGQHKPDQFLSGARAPIPWLISPAGWALYFNHPLGTFDLTKDTAVFRPSEPPQAQDLFLILSKDPAILLREYALLTGMPHLPPKWAFGFQQSHRTLASRQSVMQEMKTIRDKQLPCDVLIYLGTGYAPSGWNQGPASFAFNRKIFPDPEATFQEMHRQNFRVALHVLGAPHDLHGRVIDTSPDPDGAANYWRMHLDVFRTGIDGWWVDDGDELSPESRLARNQMYWEGSLHQRPDVRPYALHRNGYSGLQRYGFLWSGDINSSWQTLRTQIANGINTSLSGIPYWGTDTGGFFTTKEFTAELFCAGSSSALSARSSARMAAPGSSAPPGDGTLAIPVQSRTTQVPSLLPPPCIIPR